MARIEEALGRWLLVAVDVADSAAVVAAADGTQRLVHVGDELESFRVETISARKVVLRPGRATDPGVRAAVREVWLPVALDRAPGRLQLVLAAAPEPPSFRPVSILAARSTKVSEPPKVPPEERRP